MHKNFSVRGTKERGAVGGVSTVLWIERRGNIYTNDRGDDSVGADMTVNLKK